MSLDPMSGAACALTDDNFAMVMNSSIFWGTTPCGSLKVNGRFGGTVSFEVLLSFDYFTHITSNCVCPTLYEMFFCSMNCGM